MEHEDKQRILKFLNGWRERVIKKTPRDILYAGRRRKRLVNSLFSTP